MLTPCLTSAVCVMTARRHGRECAKIRIRSGEARVREHEAGTLFAHYLIFHRSKLRCNDRSPAISSRARIPLAEVAGRAAGSQSTAAVKPPEVRSTHPNETRSNIPRVAASVTSAHRRMHRRLPTRPAMVSESQRRRHRWIRQLDDER